MDNVAILINSCDAYSDAWNPFFRILEKKWPEAKEYKIYINTETKKYNDPFFNITMLNCNEDYKSKKNWGRRLKNSLKKINEEYIIVLLEDYFLEKNVPNSIIHESIKMIKNDSKIATICYMSTIDIRNSEDYDIDNIFIERKIKSEYKLNASPGIWRKDILERYTFDNDNPWEWEKFGSVRTWHSKYKYLSKSAKCADIFSYDYKRGGAIHRGKWVGCTVRKILKEHKIDIELEKRGVIEDWTKNVIESNKSSILTKLKNRLKFIKCYIIGIFIK